MKTSNKATVKIKCKSKFTVFDFKTMIERKTLFQVESVCLPAKLGGGVSKGGRFEREFSTDLSLWFSGGKDKNIFMRRPGSGGLKRDKTGDSESSGDIYADKPIGKPLTNRYSFELKFYKDLKILGWDLLLNNKNSFLEKTIEQAEAASEPYARYNIIVLRTNGRDPIVLTDDYELGFSLNWMPYFRGLVSTNMDSKAYWVSSLEEFFKLNPRNVCRSRKIDFKR